MIDLTILELHLHDGVDFAPRLGDGDLADVASADDGAGEEPDAEGGTAGKLAAAGLGLIVLLVGAAALARRAGEDEEIEVAVEEMN